MRVLFWAGSFWPLIGGAEAVAAKLLPALRERGYQFIVVASQSHAGLPREAHYRGIPVYRFPFRGGRNSIDELMTVRRQIAKVKQTFAPDLIHMSSLNVGSFFHLITSAENHAPLLVTLHSVLSSQPLGPDSWQRRLMCTANWVTCVSADVLAETSKLVPEIRPYSSVLHNGLEIPPDDPEPLPMDAPRLLCLGRLKRWKGFDVGLTAFAALVDRFPHVRLVVAGDGPERPNLEQQAVRLGLQEVVDFIGWVAPENVPALINDSTIIIMPSRHEGFGLVALEAALMARPVVASRVGALTEVIVHRQTGLLVEKENSRALTEAIGFLLDHPEKSTQMGKAARQRAQEIFSWTRCVDAYDSLYRKLIIGSG